MRAAFMRSAMERRHAEASGLFLTAASGTVTVSTDVDEAEVAGEVGAGSGQTQGRMAISGACAVDLQPAAAGVARRLSPLPQMRVDLVMLPTSGFLMVFEHMLKAKMGRQARVVPEQTGRFRPSPRHATKAQSSRDGPRDRIRDRRRGSPSRSPVGAVASSSSLGDARFLAHVDFSGIVLARTCP